MLLFSTGDDREATLVCRQILDKKKISVKEILRSLNKIDRNHNGYLDSKSFEKVLVSLFHNEIKNNQINILLNFLDPKKDNKIDINYFVSVITICNDVIRAENKLKNVFKIMRIRGIDYQHAILKEKGNNRKILLVLIYVYALAMFYRLTLESSPFP